VPTNERLLDAIARRGYTPASLAARLGVDPKTVERWVAQGRLPYPRHRHRIAALLGETELWLWPNSVDDERRDHAARSEVVRVYAHRYQVPDELWMRLIDGASAVLDVLVYAGLFLPEQTPGISRYLVARAEAGARVRLLLGDPESLNVKIRGDEEGIGDAVAIKCRNALDLYRGLAGTAVEVRLHATTLYTSIYRSDDEMIASPHVLGLPGAQAPAVHLRRLAAGDLFDTYSASFDRVWDHARPAFDLAG
jgi:hypothetical protein